MDTQSTHSRFPPLDAYRCATAMPFSMVKQQINLQIVILLPREIGLQCSNFHRIRVAMDFLQKLLFTEINDIARIFAGLDNKYCADVDFHLHNDPAK
jgi:hypothetical protein